MWCSLILHLCLFDIRNIDLPRKVKYRPRYKKPELKVDRGCRVGRNYHDYEVYMEQHPDTAVVQMDSVIGSKGGKVLLTIYFVNGKVVIEKYNNIPLHATDPSEWVVVENTHEPLIDKKTFEKAQERVKEHLKRR